MDKRLQFKTQHLPAGPSNLQSARLAAGLSITAAARVCGMTATTYEKWEYDSSESELSTESFHRMRDDCF